MIFLFLLIAFVLCMGAGGYIVYKYKEKFTDYAFVDYEIVDEDENEYPEWVDCEDESDNLYI